MHKLRFFRIAFFTGTLLAGPSLLIRAAEPLQDALAQLKSTDVTKRRVAAQELVMLRNPASAPALMEALADKNATVRTLAVRALGYMHWSAAGTRLSDLLTHDTSKEVRNEAALSLRFLSDPSALPALQKAVKDPEESVRVTSLLALGAFRNSSSVPTLLEAVKETSPGVRRNAVFALGQIGDPGTASVLTSALKDPDPAVRANAAQALATLPGLPGTEELKGALKDSDVLVQLSAARALAIRGNRSGLHLAVSKTNDSRRDIQLLSIDTLGWINDRSGTQALETLAQSKDPILKQAAEQSLHRLQEKKK